MDILPAIDLRDGKCVRLRQGDYNQETVFGDDPAAMARNWADDGATWLHLVDLDGAKAGKPENLEAVKSIVDAVNIPCELGGGIRSEESIRLLLEEIGVSRVIVGTKALKEPGWFRSMVSQFPGKIALGIDARDGMVATEGWLDVSKTSAVELAEQYLESDVAALIYTNIANDGMMQGVDDATIDDMVALAEMGFPVIASGGVTTITDVERLADRATASPNIVGAIIGRALYEGALTVSDAINAAKSK